MLQSTSKKTGYKKDFYLDIVSHIKEYHKLPVLSISKMARNYYIKRLKLDGIIFNIGYGVWSIDWDKWEQRRYVEKVKKQGSDTKSIRGHGFHYKVAIPKVSNWSKREDYLKKNDILYVKSNANWVGFRIIINKYKVWLCNNSIVIYAPKNKSFYNMTASMSRSNAINELFNIMSHIESMLGVDLKIGGKYLYKVSKQHYASIKDEMAKLVNKDSSKIVIRYNGEEWLLFDRSLNVDEQETIHPQDAHVDMDNIIKPFYNDLKEHYVKTNEALTISGLLHLINSQQEQINSLIYKKPDKLDKRDSYFG